jgi:NitT/TauT family transport system permease protein/sulfonate transport system permease protein
MRTSSIRVPMRGAGAIISDAPTIAVHTFTAAVVGVWLIAAHFLPQYLLPGPLSVGKALKNLCTNWGMLQNILASAWHVFAALVSSFVLGSGLALISREVASLDVLVTKRILPFINSFPGVGWAILALMWFGIGSFSVVFTITLVLTPLALINMRAAIDNVDAELSEMAFSFGRKRLNVIRKIVIPSLIPYAFSTFRINFGTAWKITLTAELFGGGAGLGYVMNVARQGFDMATIFAIFVVIVLFAVAMEHLIFRPLQRRLGGA